jgi:peptide/nickel transport system permease protein
MSRYLIKRLALIVPTLLATAIVIFFVLRVVPGDVVEIKLRGDGASVSQEIIERERARLGLDQPLPVQFVQWMGDLVRFDLGTSMWTGRPVSSEIASRLELSLQIAVMATVIGTLIAVPLGGLSALFPNTALDYTIRLLTMGGLAMPSFWFGMLIIMALLRGFHWLPPLVYTPFYVDPWTNLAQLIWPALAVGYRFSSVLARMVRSSAMEVLREDYVRTARAKGMRERTVLVRHALPNAMLPSITVIGLEFAFLVGGLVVTEQVFNLNGLGRLFLDAVRHNDFVLIQGVVMVLAVVFLLVNLAVDLLYGVLDPRIHYGS